jgi:methylmalonyl-CoA mutase
VELARSTEEEKRRQLTRLRDFQARHAGDRAAALDALRRTVVDGGNVFAELMNTVRHATLGEITGALFEVGGSYRRNA